MYNRVLFIGSKESGINLLRIMHRISGDTLIGCVTIEDSEDVRSKLDDYKELCGNEGIPLEILNGDYNLAGVISKYKPDLCVVMGWYYIISKDVIDMVEGGFIGVHNSLLPKYRGFAPLVWSIIEGDKRTGFSVFSFDEGMDTGKILYQEEIEIEEEDYIGDILRKIDMAVENFFEGHYMDIVSQKMELKSQLDMNVSYGARRTPLDGRIEWNRKAREIYNFIRAQSHPYPGAYTTYKNEIVVIWKSEIFPYPIYGTPGQIGLIEDNHIVVVCGYNTGLIIRNVEQNGKIYEIRDLIKGLAYKMI